MLPGAQDPYARRFLKDVKTTRTSYIAKAGGILGLCMGFSLMSGAEIIFHFVSGLFPRLVSSSGGDGGGGGGGGDASSGGFVGARHRRLRRSRNRTRSQRKRHMGDETDQDRCCSSCGEREEEEEEDELTSPASSRRHLVRSLRKLPPPAPPPPPQQQQQQQLLFCRVHGDSGEVSSLTGRPDYYYRRGADKLSPPWDDEMSSALVRESCVVHGGGRRAEMERFI